MKYTLGTAAKATDKAKSTILRAIRSGNISAQRAHDGSYEIDPSELHRVFPRKVTQPVPSHDTQPVTEADATTRLRLQIIEIERQREREQMQSTIDDLRARLDRSEERITALLAAPSPSPSPRRYSWWRWNK